jgi:hypothetical protein
LKKLTPTSQKDIIKYRKNGLPVLTRGDLRIEWINLGGGRNGNYRPDDPNDVNVLSLAILPSPTAPTELLLNSVRTGIPASTPRKQQIEALKLAMNRLYPIYEKGTFYDVKETMRALSQLSLDWLSNQQKLSRQRQEPTINSDVLIKLMGT